MRTLRICLCSSWQPVLIMHRNLGFERDRQIDRDSENIYSSVESLGRIPRVACCLQLSGIAMIFLYALMLYGVYMCSPRPADPSLRGCAGDARVNARLAPACSGCTGLQATNAGRGGGKRA